MEARMSPNKRRPIMLSHREFEIAILYLSGVPMEEIGDAAGITRERVRQLLRRTGLHYRLRQGRRPADPLRIMRELPHATSWPDLARRAGHAEKSVRRVLKVLGLTERAEAQFSTARTPVGYTKRFLINHLRELAFALGCTPGIADVNRAGGPWHSTYIKHFGSMRGAQEAAGLVPNERGGHRDREELLCTV